MKPLRASFVKRHMNRCAHFTGIQHGTCAAGISYASMREAKTETTPFRFACFQDEAQGLVCDAARWPTREEAEARERHVHERYQQINNARKAIIAHAGGKRGVRSQLPCPICKTGTLHYSIAGLNGHVHAGCTTKECVSWME